MKVLILADGKAAEVNDSYGARLIEQGKAVVILTQAEEKKPVKVEKPAQEAPAAKAAPRKKK